MTPVNLIMTVREPPVLKQNYGIEMLYKRCRAYAVRRYVMRVRGALVVPFFVPGCGR